MTLTLTPDPAPTAGPPSVLVEVASGGGNLTSVIVRRDGQLLSQKPEPGSPSAAVRDYQTRYGNPVTYTVEWVTSGAVQRESAVTVVDSVDAWLIQPRQPGFSFKLSAGAVGAGLVTLGARTNETRSTLHQTIGNPLGIVVTIGDRGSDQREITVGTTSKEERDALDNCLRSETPLLIRIPASWDLDLTEAYYRVETVTKTPLVEIAGEWRSWWTLPIKQVRAPRVIVQVLWTEADLIASYETEQDLINAYDTEYDLIINRPRS